MLCSCDLEVEKCKDLIDQINDKVGKTEEDLTARLKEHVKLQRHGWLHRYLTESDWAVLKNEDKDFNTKQKTLINRVLLLGVCNPTEGTFVSMLAILLCSDSGAELNSSHAFGVLKDIKCMLKNARPQYQRGLLEYPANPAYFRRLAPQLYEKNYSSSPVADCPLDEGRLEAIKAHLPARKTHVSVAAQPDVPKVKPADVAMQQMIFAMAKAMGPVFNRQSSELPLQFFSRPQQPPQPEQQQLALTDITEGDATKKARTAVAEDDATKTTSPKTAKSADLLLAPKTVGEMQQEMREALESSSGAVKRTACTKDERSSKPLKRPASSVLKRPASSSDEGGATEVSSLEFPGIQYKPPLKYGQCTVYTNTIMKCWRLKKQPGDKHDTSFSFKQDPEGSWNRLVDVVKSLNPSKTTS